MTTEQLLKPRYKVIAVYPFNDHFVLNETIELPFFDDRAHLTLKEWYVIQKPLSHAGHVHPVTMYESTFAQYPHLFKKLEWWEDRKPEEMPEYVRCYDILGEQVFKVNGWDFRSVSGHIVCVGEPNFIKHFHYSKIQPATREEFTQHSPKTE